MTDIAQLLPYSRPKATNRASKNHTHLVSLAITFTNQDMNKMLCDLDNADWNILSIPEDLDTTTKAPCFGAYPISLANTSTSFISFAYPNLRLQTMKTNQLPDVTRELPTFGT